MSRKGSNLLDYGIEEEIDPKHKFNSLISVTVSTLMCLAAKCPLPKSNVETTKLFLSAITDDNGKTPRNIKGFLSLLNNYSGPFENDTYKEKRFQTLPMEKPNSIPEKNEKTSLENLAFSKASTTLVLGKEITSCTDSQSFNKRNTKISLKRSEKEQSKKASKHLGSRVSPSKSVISSKS